MKRITFDFLIVSAVIYKHVFTVIGRETVMSRSVLLILLARFKYRLVALMPRLYIKQIAVFISPKHSHTVSPTCIGRRICNDNFTVSDKYRRTFVYFKSLHFPIILRCCKNHRLCCKSPRIFHFCNIHVRYICRLCLLCPKYILFTLMYKCGHIK